MLQLNLHKLVSSCVDDMHSTCSLTNDRYLVGVCIINDGLENTVLIFKNHTEVFWAPHVKKSHSAVGTTRHKSIVVIVAVADRVDAAFVMCLNLPTDRLVFYVPQCADFRDTSRDQVTWVDPTPIERSGRSKIAVTLIQIFLL
jgi:hypothetical protein